MRSTPKTTDFRLASWALVGALVCGCAPSVDEEMDSLPWTKVASTGQSSPPEAPDRTSAVDKSVLDGRELEYRDAIVHSSLEDLRRIAGNPIVVQAVEKANQESWRSQQQIDQTDAHWRQIQGVDDPLVQRYMRNPCADYLRQEQTIHAGFVELFVMDDKGCIVAESDKTSDFWQGDEDKWIECYNAGDGRVWVGDVEYDQSTRSYVVQISVPVFAADGSTIGAMTVGVCPGYRDQSSPTP